MANTYLDIEGTYKIQTNGKQLKVDALIGDAQVGAFTFLLDAQLMGQNEMTTLGNTSDLHGTKLIVSSVVQDIREETNWVSLTVFIKEEGQDADRIYGPYSKELKQDLDTVTYTIVIDLI